MKIVVLDGYTLNPGDNPWTSVEQHGELTVYDRTPSDQVVERALDAEIVLTNKTPIPREAIAELPNLQYIGVLATGYDIVDKTAARERGIPVTNVPVYGTDSVAEYVFALITEYFRQPALHSDLAKAGEWQKAGDFSFWRTPIAEDNPLLHARNIFITPHIAWAALEARRRLMQSTAENIRAFRNGAPINVVN